MSVYWWQNFNMMDLIIKTGRIIQKKHASQQVYIIWQYTA